MTTIVARTLPDGTLVEVLPDGTTRPMLDPIDWGELEAMTEEEGLAAALSDPDAKPIVEGKIGNVRRGPPVGVVRLRLRLSREAFAERYHIPIELICAWEDQKIAPDDVAQAYLKAIAADPDGVARAVAPTPKAAE